MRILEIGTNIAPAYAGMVLAEQGHDVVKLVVDDPLLHQPRGNELWEWLNSGKQVIRAAHIRDNLGLLESSAGVIDNIRAETWRRWGLDPAVLAGEHQLRWVSMRADDDDKSFDVIAQARAWGDLTPPVPFYLGDTAFGLWAAFKLLAMPGGHAIIRHATCLAKLVEGEAVIDRGERELYPWKEPGTYGFDGQAFTIYRGERIAEPLRDIMWRRNNLPNNEGRYII